MDGEAELKVELGQELKVSSEQLARLKKIQWQVDSHIRELEELTESLELVIDTIFSAD